MKFKKIFEVSFLKTLFFNLHYFGLKGIIKFPVLIARGLQLKKMSGKIILGDFHFGVLQIGFKSLGTENDSTTKGCWELKGTLYCHKKVSLARGCSISVGEKSLLEIGSLIVTGDTNIICKENITIGEGCLISWGGTIMDCDFHKIYRSNELINKPRPITIGNHVWVGMSVIVLKGASIPDNCVIAAGSIITKKLVKPNCVYVGSTPKKENIVWKE
jgi:acetyltransferase-like isoleucine patch superfamily enzyme